jgi:hypothetical protein
VSTTLRRLLNYLPLTPGGRGELYVRSSWHKPTPFDQWKSQPPFRPTVQHLRTFYFTRAVRRQRLLVRGTLAGLGAVAAIWLVVESVRGLALL